MRQQGITGGQEEITEGGVWGSSPLSSSASRPGPGLNPALAPLLNGSPNGGEN